MLITASRVPCTGELTLDLSRVYEAPFLDKPGRLPLWQGSKREEAGITATGSTLGAARAYPQSQLASVQSMS